SDDRISEAPAYFQKALALDPSYALAHYALGRLLARLSKYPEARVELEQAVALEPSLTEGYYQLAHTYVRLGESEKANRAMASFKKYQGIEQSERQELLKHAQTVIRSEP